MKKLLLVILLSVSSLSYGQEAYTESFVTKYMTVETMRWNSYVEKYDFIPKYDRSKEAYSWMITLKKDKTGYVYVDNINDGDIFGFKIHNWELIEVDGKRNAIIMQVIQLSNSEEGTIIFQKLTQSNYGVSVFLPSSKLYFFFD